MVIAKFFCRSKKQFDNKGFEIEMNPVCNGSKENEKYFQLTPYGQLSMGTLNGNAANDFIPGDEYYIIFTKSKSENVEINSLPEYICHKKVRALKIKSIVVDEAVYGSPDLLPGAIITPEDERYVPFHVDGEYMRKHLPKEGGYYVVYDDGYKSFSPAKPFEDGYSRIN